jgi:ABC-type nitrate/sulfonate/bicarbonate transport system permease component
MAQQAATVVAGLVIPSASPWFLSGVAVHVAAGLVCVVAGALAMLSRKGRGRHSTFGTVYYWALSVVFVTAAGLALVRWARTIRCSCSRLRPLRRRAWGAARRRWPARRGGITGMGSSSCC